MRDAARARFSYRDDPRVPRFPDDRPLLVFDGHCVLCSGWVGVILRRDRTHRYRMAAAQSPLGQALYAHYDLDAVQLDTILLLENGRLFTKAEACIQVAVGLGFPWSLAACLRWVPRRSADFLYDALARNRIRWFGRREACHVPQAGDEDRFLA